MAREGRPGSRGRSSARSSGSGGPADRGADRQGSGPQADDPLPTTDGKNGELRRRPSAVVQLRPGVRQGSHGKQRNRHDEICDSVVKMLDADRACLHRLHPGALRNAQLLGKFGMPWARGCPGLAAEPVPGWTEAEADAGYALQWLVEEARGKYCRMCACRKKGRGPFPDRAEHAANIFPELLGALLGHGESRLALTGRAMEVEPLDPPAVPAGARWREDGQSRPPSPRQEEIARLLGRGFSRKEIADRLGIGHESIKTHARRLARKRRDG